MQPQAELPNKNQSLPRHSKWTRIERNTAYLSGFSSTRLIVPTINLNEAEFNEAIESFNSAAKKGCHFSLQNLYLILKKYQQEGIWSLGIHSDVIFLYKYINEYINKIGRHLLEADIQDIHVCMIKYYIAQKDFYPCQFVLEAETIYKAHPSSKTATALIRAYFANGELQKAYHLCKQTHEKNPCDDLYDIYLIVLFNLPEEIIRDQKSGLVRALDFYQTLKEKHTLSTHMHRTMIELYHKAMKADDLDTVFKLYELIPAAEKNDQVRRAMLKILLQYDKLDTAINFFKLMETELGAQNLLDASYDTVLRHLYDLGEFNKALAILENAIKNNHYNYATRNSKSYDVEIDFHNRGTTGGGTPFYGGKQIYFVNLILYYHLNNLLNSKDVLPRELKGLFISGQGGKVVQNNIIGILRLYGVTEIIIQEGSLTATIPHDLKVGHFKRYEKQDVSSISINVSELKASKVFAVTDSCPKLSDLKEFEALKLSVMIDCLNSFTRSGTLLPLEYMNIILSKICSLDVDPRLLADANYIFDAICKIYLTQTPSEKTYSEMMRTIIKHQKPHYMTGEMKKLWRYFNACPCTFTFNCLLQAYNRMKNYTATKNLYTNWPASITRDTESKGEYDTAVDNSRPQAPFFTAGSGSSRGRGQHSSYSDRSKQESRGNSYNPRRGGW